MCVNVYTWVHAWVGVGVRVGGFVLTMVLLECRLDLCLHIVAPLHKPTLHLIGWFLPSSQSFHCVCQNRRERKRGKSFKTQANVPAPGLQQK